MVVHGLADAEIAGRERQTVPVRHLLEFFQETAFFPNPLFGRGVHVAQDHGMAAGRAHPHRVPGFLDFQPRGIARQQEHAAARVGAGVPFERDADAEIIDRGRQRGEHLLAVEYVAVRDFVGGRGRRHDRPRPTALGIEPVQQLLPPPHVAEIAFFLPRGHQRRVERDRVAVHVDRERRGGAALHELLLCQDEGEWGRSPAAVLLRRGHRGVARLLEAGDVLERKAALAVVPFGAFAEFRGQLFGRVDDPLLVRREIDEHGALLHLARDAQRPMSATPVPACEGGRRPPGAA